jgi:ATP-binding cassette subfamily B protein
VSLLASSNKKPDKVSDKVSEKGVAPPTSLKPRDLVSIQRFKDFFSLLPRAAKLAWNASPRQVSWLVALTLVAALVPPATAWVGKAIVDAVVARDHQGAQAWVLVEVGLVATMVFLSRGGQLTRQNLGAKLGHDVNVIILQKALTLDLGDFEDPSFYDQLTRARREASSRPLTVITQTFDIARSVLTLSGYAALLLAFSPLACLALAVASLPATIAERRFGQMAFNMRNWRSPDTRRLNYMERVLASDDHAKEVKLLGIGPILLDRYETLGKGIIADDAALAKKRFWWGSGLSLIATGVYYGVYLMMVLAAADGVISLGEMTLYAVAFRQGQQSFETILASIGSMHEHSLYLSNLYGYLDRPVTARTSADTTLSIGKESPHLRLEDVSFRYPGSERWAVRHVTLDVPKEKSLALVGFNGAGKTTLIKLLLGLYQPTEGRVTLNGHDLASLPERERLAAFAVVFQDFSRYQLSVRENIGFGSSEHLDDDEHLAEAIDRGGASELLGRLPDKLDTQLGKWFDKGVELSGGEWQKIALARSFAREEAKVLILDEPTAALDAQAEHAIFERFRELTKGRTSILISHRFPTVRMADRIVVLDAGEIKESGTHAELLAQGGTYAKLFELQAEGYR